MTTPLSVPLSVCRPGARTGSVWPVTSSASPAVQKPQSDPQAHEALAAVPACEKTQVNECCKAIKTRDERNLASPELMRDVVIGLADGLVFSFLLDL